MNEDSAIIKISDQGIGIHQNEIALVQERFYRAGNSNRANGSGLGLSLCKEIVEKFNGQLMVESEIGVGTNVTLSLPEVLVQSEAMKFVTSPIMLQE